MYQRSSPILLGEGRRTARFGVTATAFEVRGQEWQRSDDQSAGKELNRGNQMGETKRTSSRKWTHPLSFLPTVIFGVVCAVVAILSLDFHGVRGKGDPKHSSQRFVDQERELWNKLDNSAKEFLQKEHEVTVAEIRLRIEQEHLLFALKFFLVGGTLYLLLHRTLEKEAPVVEKTEVTSLLIWAAVITASIVDLRIVANQSFITTLGEWVRRYEELLLGSEARGLGWEAFLADRLLSARFYPALRMSGQILTVLLFWIAGAQCLLPDEIKCSRRIAMINGAGAIVSVIFMTGVAMSLRREGSGAAIQMVLGVVAGAGCVFLAYASIKQGEAVRSSAKD